MQNNSEIQRPPKPNWRNEITIPTESQDLINENGYNFTLDSSITESSDSKPPTEYLTPTEEYLQMTKQLIESRSLPSRTTKMLKQLYVKYKSINDYGSTIVASDQSIQAEKEADKQKRSARSRMQLNSFRTIWLRKSEQMPSTSKYDERPTTSSMDIKKSAKLDQEESSRSTESPFDDFVIPWYGLQDFMFGRPCDPDLIKIDNVFSDFTLRDAGHEKAIRNHIRQWIEKRLLAIITVVAIRRVLFGRRNENVEQGTKTSSGDREN